MSEETVTPEEGAVNERLAAITAAMTNSQDALQAQQEQILAAIGELQQKVGAQQSVSPAAASVPSQGTSVFDSVDYTKQNNQNENIQHGVNTGDVGSIIKKEIAAAMAPLVEESRRNQQLKALNEAHLASVEKAKKAHPNLKDLDSPMAQAFDKIWQARPDLQQLKDAPMIVAELARGITADIKVQDKSVAERKQLAAVTPARSGLRQMPTQLDEANDLLAKMKHKADTQGLPQNEFADYTGLLISKKLTEAAQREQIT